MESIVQQLLGDAHNPFQGLIQLFRAGGWIAFLPVFYFMVKDTWFFWIWGMYAKSKKQVLLAIDVPKLNEQSMKAVEQIIANMHGVFIPFTFKQKWWQGMFLDTFSLELVSIDGYIQYFIRCDTYNVDLVKGAIFAQYPDAEIVEVEDYVPNAPQKYPDPKFDLFGVEFVLAKSDVYPIKTYEYFEHPLTGIFADPMAAILEIMSRLRPGEQVWLQFVITPQAFSWRDKGVAEFEKLIGRKKGSTRNTVDKILDAPLVLLEGIHNALFSATGITPPPPPVPDSLGNYLNLTTGEQQVIVEIQKKIARIPFQCKFRFIYIAPKEIFSPPRVAAAIQGSIKQFNTTDLNALVYGRRTRTNLPAYIFPTWQQNVRKNRIFNSYKGRSNWEGELQQVLSNVEIASIFHFPVMTVKAPLVTKTVSKKSEPPARLPFDIPSTVLQPSAEQMVEPASSPDSASSGQQIPVPPSGLPQRSIVPPPPPPPSGGTATPQVDLTRSMAGLPPNVRPIKRLSPSPSGGSTPTQPVPGPTNIPTPTQQSSDPNQKGQPPANLPFA
ncbi:MAG: hypothetical protein HYV32_05270 [Candidatus Kerfeldbacteria bacterium]|nr:hypothetical protein [Candidatus Kerfeldbacteria bacterium]